MNNDKREEAAEEGECQILNFMGMANSLIQYPKTLKLKGELRGIPIQVLVDSGAFHNFISHKLVSLLGFPTQSFAGLNIRLSDGHRIWVQEKCEQIEVKLGEFSCVLSALVFELGNLGMVLGIEWLKTLGEVNP